MRSVGNTPIGQEGIAAALDADLSNGTPPSAAVTTAKRPVKSRKVMEQGPSRGKELGLG